jgi:hypothetical protein
MNIGVVLPETPEGFCAQTIFITPGSSEGNGQLQDIAREGGRVVAVVPIEYVGSAKILVVYFAPLNPEDFE